MVYQWNSFKSHYKELPHIKRLAEERHDGKVQIKDAYDAYDLTNRNGQRDTTKVK